MPESVKDKIILGTESSEHEMWENLNIIVGLPEHSFYETSFHDMQDT